MNRDAIVLLILISAALGISTWQYAGKDAQVQDDFFRVRKALATLHPHIKKPSRIGVLISGGKGTEFQHGENVLYYASLRWRRSPKDIQEDTLLLFYRLQAPALFDADSAGYRDAWHHADSETYYQLLIRK